jgi:hypothetical protein
MLPPPGLAVVIAGGELAAFAAAGHLPARANLNGKAVDIEDYAIDKESDDTEQLSE